MLGSASHFILFNLSAQSTQISEWEPKLDGRETKVGLHNYKFFLQLVIYGSLASAWRTAVMDCIGVAAGGYNFSLESACSQEKAFSPSSENTFVIKSHQEEIPSFKPWDLSSSLASSPPSGSSCFASASSRASKQTVCGRSDAGFGSETGGLGQLQRHHTPM